MDRNDHKEHLDAALLLIENAQWDGLRTLFESEHPADIAVLIARTPDDLRKRVFNLLEDDKKADVFSELDDAVEEELLDALPPQQISAIVEDMPPDDAADVLGEMDAERSETILNLMDDEESQDVRDLLAYDDESAGGIMNSDFVALPRHKTAEDALKHIGEQELEEPLHFIYVIDADGMLCGYVQLWKILKAENQKQPLGELAETDLFFAHTDTDQEEVARLMSKYDLSSLPVLDALGRLVGRVTIDDVVDVLEEEASEDIFKLAGSSDEELEYTSAFRASRARLPWLLITLGTGLITSMILKSFMQSISTMEVLALSFFVPIVMAMGGNTGIQSSTLIIRGLAIGSFGGRNLYRVFLREMITGMIMGSVCGLAIGLWAAYIIGGGTAYPPVTLAIAVGLALFCAMMFAATFGALTPLVLNRFKCDPAVASGPFVSASNDIFALLIYYGIIVMLLPAMAR